MGFWFKRPILAYFSIPLKRVSLIFSTTSVRLEECGRQCAGVMPMSPESVDLVVLIDDSEIDLFVQKRFIEISAFSRRILEFKSARQALEHLSAPGQVRPDLIFLDLNMPEMDGFTFLERMSQASTSPQRVVILSSSSSGADKARAATFSNVVCFLSKPLNEKRLAELKDLVRG
jgi:two-component system nitrate/nitrite response regulator NarL